MDISPKRQGRYAHWGYQVTIVGLLKSMVGALRLTSKQ